MNILKNIPDFGVEFSVEEIIVYIRDAESVLVEECIGSRAVGGIAEGLLARSSRKAIRAIRT